MACTGGVEEVYASFSSKGGTIVPLYGNKLLLLVKIYTTVCILILVSDH